MILLATGGSFDLNLVLNVVTVAIVIGAAFPVLRSKRKDATIAELKESVDSKDERIGDLTAERDECKLKIRQFEQACGHLREELAELRGAYDQQSRYTAEQALETVLEVLKHGDVSQRRRHEELMKMLHTLTEAVKR